MSGAWNPHELDFAEVNSDVFSETMFYGLIKYTLNNIFTLIYDIIMKSLAIPGLPGSANRSLVKLGEDMSIARRKRRISTESMAERAFISRSTLYKIERGDPSVSIGAYVSVLAVLRLTEGMAQLADRRNDSLGLDLEEHRLPKRVRSGRRTRMPF